MHITKRPSCRILWDSECTFLSLTDIWPSSANTLELPQKVGCMILGTRYLSVNLASPNDRSRLYEPRPRYVCLVQESRSKSPDRAVLDLRTALQLARMRQSFSISEIYAPETPTSNTSVVIDPRCTCLHSTSNFRKLRLRVDYKPKLAKMTRPGWALGI